MISNYALAKAPVSRMLMALLLVVQLLCVVASAFATESADDIHHNYQTDLQNNYQSGAQEAAFSQVESSLPDSDHHHGCDHCSHCHAAHIGLFKPSPALPVSSGEQPASYQNHLPSSPNRSIYRPPIA